MYVQRRVCVCAPTCVAWFVKQVNQVTSWPGQTSEISDMIQLWLCKYDSWPKIKHQLCLKFLVRGCLIFFLWPQFAVIWWSNYLLIDFDIFKCLYWFCIYWLDQKHSKSTSIWHCKSIEKLVLSLPPSLIWIQGALMEVDLPTTVKISEEKLLRNLVLVIIRITCCQTF